jgi:hypothetical protein
MCWKRVSIDKDDNGATCHVRTCVAPFGDGLSTIFVMKDNNVGECSGNFYCAILAAPIANDELYIPSLPQLHREGGESTLQQLFFIVRRHDDADSWRA